MRFVSVCAALLCVACAWSQDAKAPSPAVDADVATIDGIVAAVYSVISGPAGAKRDWDRMRALFVPDARMVATGKRRNGDAVRQTLTVEDYIKGAGPILEQRGFFEKETERKLETFGTIAHVWSHYESREKPDDAKPFESGVNSIQLWNDGKRWWVVSIFWQGA